MLSSELKELCYESATKAWLAESLKVKEVSLLGRKNFGIKNSV